MNIRKLMIAVVMILTIGIVANLYLFQDNYEMGLDIVKVNDIVQSVAKEWSYIDKVSLPHMEYGLEYVVIDTNENLIAATSSGLNENISSAIKNGDTIVDVILDDQVVGKVLFYNHTADQLWQYQSRILIISLSALVLLSVICLLYGIYINKAIFHPFRKLQNFARHIALGNLDVPLEMDKGNLFGAFSESFDLMREELERARENERLANQSKKELVASLSHDIKTPVASIKAVSELMYVKTREEDMREQLEIIGSKADQIDLLITNMFNATLEELQELKVTATEVSSILLLDSVKNADYNHQVAMGDIPECIILADVQRLEQVIDNILSNSYKYANTSIDCTVCIKGNYLEIEFKDYGPGVSDEELPLLFHKFYRAGNVNEKSGAGLGLYISKYLTNKMGGELTCHNTADDFSVTLALSLAGKKI